MSGNAGFEETDPSGVMELVPLHLTDGTPIGVTARIPKFVRWPEVLIWGDRVFKRHSTVKPYYCECFAVVVVDWELKP